MTSTFDDACRLLDDAGALKAAAHRDGFLYFRNYMDPAPLRSLRRQILEVLDSFWLLDHGAALDEAIAAADWRNGCEDHCGSGIPAEVYQAVQRLEEFHVLPHHPRLRRLQELLVDAVPFVHPGIIGRIILPRGFATPPHQDIVHTKGSENTWTCWLPLGDVPRGLGSVFN